MKVKYITDPQDINAHLTGEVVVSIDAHGEETRVPVIHMEADEVLSLDCPVPALIVLLDIGASLSVPNEIAQQCGDLRVYSQAMATAGGEVQRGKAVVAAEGDEAAAREQIAASRAASKVPAKKAKKAPAKAKKAAEPEDASYVGSTREGKRRGRQPAKKAKKTAVKKTKKGKRAAEPKGKRQPFKPSTRQPFKPTQVVLPEPLPSGDS